MANNKKILLIVGGIAAAIVLVGGGIFAGTLLNKDKSDNTNSNQQTGGSDNVATAKKCTAGTEQQLGAGSYIVGDDIDAGNWALTAFDSSDVNVFDNKASWDTHKASEESVDGTGYTTKGRIASEHLYNYTDEEPETALMKLSAGNLLNVSGGVTAVCK